MKQKVAFITGAATGIGKSTAILLANEGNKVIVTDINEPMGQEAANAINASGGSAQFYKLDVSNQDEVNAVTTQVMQKEGSIDYAVNNAGISGDFGPFHEMTIENWNKVIAIDLTSILFCIQSQIKCMLQTGAGSIVNVSSMAGLRGAPGGAAYSAAKHGVIGLTKSTAIEYGRLNIRVNAVCPGFTETAILEAVPQKTLDFSSNVLVPMKRLGKPAEIAETISYLLSERASFINGHALPIDGGMSA
jgi:NAD(P)-dependent dehydrogenase (short-subunit alcohol dehydrogenase family)